MINVLWFQPLKLPNNIKRELVIILHGYIFVTMSTESFCFNKIYQNIPQERDFDIKLKTSLDSKFMCQHHYIET